jgi:patatin-like phospholipase/acyl hydrolase
LQDRILSTGPKKLLSIDGGGIRGVVALEILVKIETLFAKWWPNYVLADDFDYISGTSRENFQFLHAVPVIYFIIWANQ